MNRVVFIALLGLASTPALAAPRSASQFLADCDSGGLEATMCVEYVRGILETMYHMEQFYGLKVCLPREGISTRSVLALVSDGIQTTPSWAREPANRVVFGAIRQRYECPVSP